MTTTINRQHASTEKRRKTPGNRRWRFALAVGGAVVVVAFIAAIVTLGASEQTRDLTSGFEYNNEATPAHVAADEPVTGEYFGHSDEFWPAKGLTSGFDLSDDTSPGIGRRSRPIGRLYFGNSPELNPDH
jgi:hypothetical protein